MPIVGKTGPEYERSIVVMFLSTALNELEIHLSVKIWLNHGKKRRP
jgi:hypothetical protein